MKYLKLLCASIIVMAGCSASANEADLEVYLVRHAEKTTDQTDPALTERGEQRADALADVLSVSGITRIHSSDYKRTRATAAPLAERLGIEVELYDPRDLAAIAETLKSEGGKHLVVGHSNTTPQLTELLGGDGGEPIVEATEYDRLYIVSRQNGETTSTLLRFGPPE